MAPGKVNTPCQVFLFITTDAFLLHDQRTMNDMDPDHNPNESLPAHLIKRECNNFPNLQYPIYYSEANNHLIYLLIATRNFFLCVCVCVRVMKIATDKIRHARQMHVMVS